VETCRHLRRTERCGDMGGPAQRSGLRTGQPYPSMIKHGVAPFLECSSRGDKRFSAFYARPTILDGYSIEEAYQGTKIFSDGTTGLDWREAKGRRHINIAECEAFYRYWWREWVREQNLLPILKAASGLTDIFGQPGHVCQASVLWQIRNEPLIKFIK
jgi:hypothetical protein